MTRLIYFLILRLHKSYDMHCFKSTKLTMTVFISKYVTLFDGFLSKCYVREKISTSSFLYVLRCLHAQRIDLRDEKMAKRRAVQRHWIICLIFAFKILIQYLLQYSTLYHYQAHFLTTSSLFFYTLLYGRVFLIFI